MTVNPTDPAVVADVLERAADRLSKPRVWIQGAYARKRGHRGLVPADPLDRRAVCWCGLGATLKEMGRPAVASILFHPVIRHMADVFGGNIGSFVSWNDAPERTQSEVVAKLREAAAKARALLQETNHD